MDGDFSDSVLVSLCVLTWVKLKVHVVDRHCLPVSQQAYYISVALFSANISHYKQTAEAGAGRKREKNEFFLLKKK